MKSDIPVPRCREWWRRSSHLLFSVYRRDISAKPLRSTSFPWSPFYETAICVPGKPTSKDEPGTSRVSLLFDARPRSRLLPHLCCVEGTEAPHPSPSGRDVWSAPGRCLLDLPCDCGHAMERRGTEDVEGGPNQKTRPPRWLPEPMGAGMVLTLPHLATACGVSGLQQRLFLCRGEARRCWRRCGVLMGISH